MRVTERDIERAATGLGAEAADRLDLERVTARVAARLAASGGVVEPRPVWRWLAAAAGIILVAGAGYLTFGTDGAPPGVGRPLGLTPSLLDLSVSELHAVLDSLDQPAPRPLSAEASLDDLDAEQLETLLAMMEG
jgi:hypothetical protein